MTRVAKLDKNGDWTFGKGKANYVSNSDAIKQNVVTRLKSFVNDWFLDISEGLDWYNLLGKKGTKDQILRRVESRVLQTFGVRSLEKLEITKLENRIMTLEIGFTTIFDEAILTKERIEL